MSKKGFKKEQKQVVEVLKKAPKINHRLEFKKYFTKLQYQLKLSANMEEILWLHLQSIECAEVEKFEDGIKHFGYTLK